MPTAHQSRVARAAVLAPGMRILAGSSSAALGPTPEQLLRIPHFGVLRGVTPIDPAFFEVATIWVSAQPAAAALGHHGCVAGAHAVATIAAR